MGILTHIKNILSSGISDLSSLLCGCCRSSSKKETNKSESKNSGNLNQSLKVKVIVSDPKKILLEEKKQKECMLIYIFFLQFNVQLQFFLLNNQIK